MPWWDDLRAISLSQPWCFAVVHPVIRKWIENRSWQPPIEMIGKRIAIHAAKSWDEEPIYLGPTGYKMRPYSFLEAYGFVDLLPARYDEFMKSTIVGVATIDRIVSKPDTLPDDQKKWFFGPFGWVLTDVRRLTLAVECKGKQGLWKVPSLVATAVGAQLSEAA